MIRIGYQGIGGSNSEQAAQKLCHYKCIQDFELIPLITSAKVVENLQLGEIDYGVMAYKNNIGGKVEETLEALSQINYELVGRCEMVIHHSLFIYDSSTKIQDIKQIVSHEQAIKQCIKYIETNFPHVKVVKNADTALAAKQLKDGVWGTDTAVICKKDAGLEYGLYCVDENIEDTASVTEFRLIKKGGFDLNNSTDVSRKEKRKDAILHILTNPISYVLLFLISYVLCVLGSIVSWECYVISAIIGIFTIVLVALRKRIKTHIKVSNILGYWKYYSSAVSGYDPNQQHDYLRLVEISQSSNKLSLKIWMGADFTNPYVVSTKTLATTKDNLNGSLVYWYNGTVNVHTNASITGVAVLEWTVESPNKQVNVMKGWYLGAASKEIGSLTYTRISKEEFDYIKGSKAYKI